MEQETLFTASKWDILTALQGTRRSPVELAKLLNTSVANISQQLRLLEMAGLVTSKRISNREKGLPRVLYSLAGNHSYLIAAAKEFVDKKFFRLTERNKVVMRIWFLERPDAHYYLEKAFWKLDDHLKKIDAILFDEKSDGLALAIVANDEKLKLSDLKIKNPDGVERTIKIKIIDEKTAKKGDYYKLYDAAGILSEKDERGDGSE